MARDARGARRLPAALLLDPPPDHARDEHDRHLLPGRDTRLRRFVFGIDLTVEHKVAFGVSIVGTVLSFGALGFLFAVSFVRFRAAWALGNLFEYPVWLIGGFLVPLVLLPDWVRPISWVLAPTWGMNAIRESALGGTPWPDLALCLALGVTYVSLGVLALDRVLGAARKRATPLVDMTAAESSRSAVS